MNRACFFTFSSCRLSILLASEQMIAAFLVVTPPSVDHQAEDPSVPRPRWTILASDTLPGLCLIRVTAESRIRGTRTAAKSARTRTAAAAPACREDARAAALRGRVSQPRALRRRWLRRSFSRDVHGSLGLTEWSGCLCQLLGQ